MAMDALPPPPAAQELHLIGERVYQNETGGNRDFLVQWNPGEDFPSLGIGHFIWYVDKRPGPFEESFAELLAYYKQQRVPLPAILASTAHAPWSDASQLEAQRHTPPVEQLTAFLDDTRDTQVAFLYRRLDQALAKMKAVSVVPAQVERQFRRVANSPGGYYPLIDYVNFKGEGTLASERYGGKGWGLLQVLEGMSGDKPGQAALAEFSRSAARVLTERVQRSPLERGEQRWLAGWLQRVGSYAGPL